MPDYQKGKIYKLWSPSKNLVYYGSTIETLSSRLSKHKYSYKTYNNDKKKYCTSYLILECEDYKIELVEEYPCNNKDQLFKKEGEYIKANECINKNVSGRTKQEWTDENKEKVDEYKKKYIEENIDKVKECKKNYEEKNREKINQKQKEYYNTEKRKQYMKEYYNTEERKQYMREYYQKNKKN